jgi:hypothetical protein
MKDLADINKDYVKNIIEFFCRKSLETILLSPSGKGTGGEFTYQLRSWIENHIRKRLFDKEFITNYDISVNINSLRDHRDYKIDKVLGNQVKELKDYIRVSVRFPDRSFDTFDYVITKK